MYYHAPCPITDQKSISRKYSQRTARGGKKNNLWMNQRGVRPLRVGLFDATPLKKGLLISVFHALILSSVFQMEREKKERIVYSGYLEREMERTSWA